MAEKIDEQTMSEMLSKSKDVNILGIRGTGYEGDILDLLVDDELYFILKAARIPHRLRWGGGAYCGQLH